MATVELADIRRAVGPGAGVVRRTPVLVSQGSPASSGPRGPEHAAMVVTAVRGAGYSEPAIRR